MSGDWLKIEANTPDKPEILAVASALNLDPDSVFGKCFRLWRWFDSHTESGNARSVTKTTLDRMLGVTGLCDELEKVGWLYESNGEILLPKFDRHNSKTAKTRALTAKRVAEYKRKGNAEVTRNALPREEKRIEKKINTNTCSTSRASASKLSSKNEPEGFADWYQAYPRHVGRAAAAKAYPRAVQAFVVRDGLDESAAVQALLEVTKRFRTSDAGNAGDYTPHPATWLNAARYFDDESTWQRCGKPQGDWLAELKEAERAISGI